MTDFSALLIIQTARQQADWLPILSLIVGLGAQRLLLRRLLKHTLKTPSGDESKLLKRINAISQIVALLLMIGFTILFVNVGIGVGWAILWALLSAVVGLFVIALLTFILFPKLLKAYSPSKDEDETTPI